MHGKKLSQQLLESTIRDANTFQNDVCPQKRDSQNVFKDDKLTDNNT